MNEEVARISAELVAELASNEKRPQDPRYAKVRFSALKHMARSPLHYRHALQHGMEETLSMRLGSGTHALVFGTPKVVVFKPRRAGKLWDAFEAEHVDDVILNEREHAIATAMARALTTDFLADMLTFAPGTEHERKVEWKFGNRECSGRIDALGPDFLIDLKAVQDADPRWFPYQVRRMYWAEQVTWYADGCEAAGLGWRHPHLVAVENSAPYAVSVWRLTEADIVAARNRYSRWLVDVLQCEAANKWPGYSSEVISLGFTNGGDDDNCDV